MTRPERLWDVCWLECGGVIKGGVSSHRLTEMPDRRIGPRDPVELPADTCYLGLDLAVRVEGDVVDVLEGAARLTDVGIDVQVELPSVAGSDHDRVEPWDRPLHQQFSDALSLFDPRCRVGVDPSDQRNDDVEFRGDVLLEDRFVMRDTVAKRVNASKRSRDVFAVSR